MKTNAQISHLSKIPFEIRWVCHYDRGHLPQTLLKNKIWALLHAACAKENRIKVISLEIDQGLPCVQGFCSNLAFLEEFFSPLNKSLAVWLNDPRPIYRRAAIAEYPQETLLPQQFGENIFKKTFYVGNYDWIRWQRRQAYLKFLHARA